jgi:hypothetical protein
MTSEKPAREQMVLNDVGSWGDKSLVGAYDGPLNIAGELVRVEELPPFGDDEHQPPKTARDR